MKTAKCCLFVALLTLCQLLFINPGLAQYRLINFEVPTDDASDPNYSRSAYFRFRKDPLAYLEKQNAISELVDLDTIENLYEQISFTFNTINTKEEERSRDKKFRQMFTTELKANGVDTEATFKPPHLQTQPTTHTRALGHVWIVLVNGGGNMMTNYPRYWNNMSLAYMTAIDIGVPNEQIFIHASDGNSSSIDQRDLTSSSLDYNDDGTDEDVLPATYFEIE